MCGFAGWFDVAPDAGPPPPEQRRREALDLLAPRGPDDEGEWIAPDGRAGLLHRRLAIVDREGGHQPMAGPEPGQMLAWNGELFEADALRAELATDGHRFRTRSDTEVLARLVAVHGEWLNARLSSVCGQWAFAWIDVERGHLTLARDPAGEKPLFYSDTNGRVCFASSLDALRALCPFGHALAPEALSLYLSWGFVPAPRTVFGTVSDGIAKVSAGTAARWNRPVAPGAQVDRIIGSIGRPPLQPSSLEEALTAASHRCLEHSDEPVGLFLSGGLDSLAIATVLRDAPGLRTFTVRADDARYDESADAALVANALGIEHTVIDPPPAAPDAWREVLLRHGEPFGSTSALAVDAVARAAKEHVRVVLTGDGGDEALGGYPRHVLLQRLARLPSLPGWAAPSEGARLRRVRRAARLLSLTPADRYAQMYEVFGEHRTALTPDDDGSIARDWIRRHWGDAPAGDLDAMLRVDRAVELPDSHCVKVDVQCMAHGVEARSPWLDRDVVAACDALPPEQRLHRGRTKIALRELLRRRLPTNVADHVLSRPKRGFTAGLDDALGSPEAEDLLFGGALDRVPGLVPEAARPWLAEHRAGRGNHRFRLSVLLALALFAEARLR
jgi:asparagine synthase (glutamine-hydrolysing)